MKKWIVLAAVLVAAAAGAAGVAYKARPAWLGVLDGNPGSPPSTRPERAPDVRPDGTPWETSPIGTNLMGPSYWGTNLPFVDLIRASGNLGGDPKEPAVDVEPSGWPRRLAEGQSGRVGVLLSQGAAHAPVGRYTLLYQGKGKFRNLGNGRIDREASRPGRDVLTVTEQREAGFLLDLMETDPSDPARQVRLLLPGGACAGDAARACQTDAECTGAGKCVEFAENYAEQIFNPMFLQKLRGYSVLRFMDWMDTNWSRQRTWADRPTLEQRTWLSDSGEGGGVPVEILVALANHTGAHPWFTLPHGVDDDYVRRFARIVAAGLDPELRAWVEYSNEVWNPGFAQHDYAREQGTKKLLSKEGNVAAARFYAGRSVEIFKIFEEEFGDTSRLVRVLATQSVNTWLTQHILSWQDAWKHADALAIAPYFGFGPGQAEEAEEFEALSVDALIDRLQAEALPASRKQMAAQREIADEFGLRLVAYEGGQHMVANWPARNRPAVNELFDAVQRHPRMKDLYLAYLNDWKEVGGELFVHFSDCANFSKHGRWGALEYLDQPREDAPKYDGLQTFREQTPLWW